MATNYATFGGRRIVRGGTNQRDFKTGRSLPGEVSGDGLPMAGSGERGADRRAQDRMSLLTNGPRTSALDNYQRMNADRNPLAQNLSTPPSPRAAMFDPMRTASAVAASTMGGMGGAALASAPRPAPLAATVAPAGFPMPSRLRPEDLQLGRENGLGAGVGRVLHEGAIDSGASVAHPAGAGGELAISSKYGTGTSTPGWQHAITRLYPAIGEAGTAANDEFVKAYRADPSLDPFQLAHQIHSRKAPDPTGIGGAAYVNPLAGADIKAPTPIGGPVAPVPWAGGDVSGAIANFPMPTLRTPEQQRSEASDAISGLGGIKAAGRGVAGWMSRAMFGGGAGSQAQAKPAPSNPDMQPLPAMPRSSSPIPGFGLEPSQSSNSFPSPNFDELRRRIGSGYQG